MIQSSSERTKTFIFLSNFFLFICFLMILGVFIDKEIPSLGRKPFLIIGIYLMLFYNGIKWLIAKVALPENKVTVQICLLITFLWAASVALFFPLLVVPTRTGRLLIPEIYLKWIATHTLYISGWILIFYKVQTAIAKETITRITINILGIFFILIVIGLTIFFNFSAGSDKYLPPEYLVQIHPNPLFIIIEFFYLIAAITIFIGSFSYKKTEIILTSMAIILFLLFNIFTEMGRLTFNRMRYDFIFFGPVLLSLGLSLKNITRRIVDYLRKS